MSTVVQTVILVINAFHNDMDIVLIRYGIALPQFWHGTKMLAVS